MTKKWLESLKVGDEVLVESYTISEGYHVPVVRICQVQRVTDQRLTLTGCKQSFYRVDGQMVGSRTAPHPFSPQIIEPTDDLWHQALMSRSLGQFSNLSAQVLGLVRAGVISVAELDAMSTQLDGLISSATK